VNSLPFSTTLPLPWFFYFVSGKPSNPHETGFPFLSFPFCYFLVLQLALGAGIYWTALHLRVFLPFFIDAVDSAFFNIATQTNNKIYPIFDTHSRLFFIPDLAGPPPLYGA
jgi:hypothetical protein